MGALGKMIDDMDKALEDAKEQIELLKDENESLAFENKNFGDYLANEGLSHDDINSIALKAEYPYN